MRLNSLLCVLLFPLPAYAIDNVERAIIDQPADGMHASLSLLSNGASGNTSKNATRADALALWQHGRHTEYAQVQHAYGSSRGQTDTDRAFVHLRHRSDLDSNWSMEGYAQTGRDRFARLSQRTLLGGGLRYTLFRADSSAGYLGLGAFHERELINPKTGTTDPLDTTLWRANSYLILKQQFNPQVRFNNTLYYQPAMAMAADYRVFEQAALLVKLSEGLDLKLSLDVTFDSRPAQGVQKRDVLYSSGLEVSF